MERASWDYSIYPNAGATCISVLSTADFVPLSFPAPLSIAVPTSGIKTSFSIHYKYPRFTMCTIQSLRTTWTRPSSLGAILLRQPKSPVHPRFTSPFSTSRYLAMLTTELSEADVSALRVNKERLAKDLHHSCQWGSGIRWGK